MIIEPKISVIGTGYVGLIVGVCLAKKQKIICADIDTKKIEALKNGVVPIFEPGTKELIKENKKNLFFTSDIIQAIKDSNIIFVAVNTPSSYDGSADITAIEEVSKTIGQNLNENKIICIKSTVPINTHKKVENIINSFNSNYTVDIVSIPEFLREGTAIEDFINPDRVIIGTKNLNSFNILKNIYLSSINCDKIIWTDNAAAETIKYVSNSFLALKVSFINEIANFCDAMNVDVFSVSQGVGLDKRIGQQFLKPGPGFGGSCFPKDVQALIKMSDDIGINLEIIKSAVKTNELQKDQVIKKLIELVGNLQNKKIAILGLAFKSNTDDIRKSPAIDVIKKLQNFGALIKAYDPKAMENMQKEIPQLQCCPNAYKAVENVDAILILTDWNDFKELNFVKISKIVNQKIILDTRNILDIQTLKQLEFRVDTIGRSCIAKNKLDDNNFEKLKKQDSFIL